MLESLVRMFLDIDVRDVAPTVHVPALILHRRHDMLVNIGNGRWLAEHMPNAPPRRAARPRPQHLVPGPRDDARRVQEFLTGRGTVPEPERILATVLFTDIVDSTRTAVELGDRRWRDVLERHAADVREALPRFPRAGDQVDGRRLPRRFDGPARRSIARRRSSRPPRRSDPRARWRAHRRVRGDRR